MTCVAVIPAWRAESTIVATLASLRLGNAAAVRRVVVVTGADDPTAAVAAAWARRDPAVSLDLAPRRRSAGLARNHGRRAAGACGATHLLFVDADCCLEPGAASRLLSELEAGDAGAVAARVVASAGVVAAVRHLLEFKEAASLREPPPHWIPPSTAMLCRAEAFDRVGGFPDLWPGEDLVFGQRLRDAGLAVLRSRDAVACHRHPPGFVRMLGHQVRLGRTSALARAMVSMPGSIAARRPWLAPLVGPGRALRVAAWQAREGPRALLLASLLGPLWIAGLAAWTAGFVAGSVAGAGPRGRRAAEAA